MSRLDFCAGVLGIVVDCVLAQQAMGDRYSRGAAISSRSIAGDPLQKIVAMRP